MKVKQLIELLQKCDEEAPVEITSVNGERIFQLVSVTEMKYHYTEEARAFSSKVELKAGD
jgi:hypothetical protein